MSRGIFSGPALIGVAGQTASGKTTFCNHLRDKLAAGSMVILALDSYYRSQDHMSANERETVNYDHPDVFDYPLLVDHMEMLSQWQSVDVPVYDFSAHTRSPRTTKMKPAQFVFVEGTLTLYWKELRDRFHFTVFVDAPADIRLKRRIDRDTRDRGRTRESVLRQWHSTVLPMTEAFCTPTRHFADIEISGESWDAAMVDSVVTGATALLHN